MNSGNNGGWWEVDVAAELSGLDREALVVALQVLYERSGANREFIELLYATDQVEILRARIRRVRELDDYVGYDKLDDLSARLSDLLADIDKFSPSAEDAVTLLLEFFETDKSVMENSDDDGSVGMVYLDVATPLLKTHWQQLESPELFMSRIQELSRSDEYGLRKALSEVPELS